MSLEMLRSQIAEQEKCVDFFRERKLKRQRLSTIIKKFCACSAFDFMHCEEETENKNDSNELTHETQTNKLKIQENFVKYDNFVQVQSKEANRESNELHLEKLCDDDNEHKISELECEGKAKATWENDDKLEIKEVTSERKHEEQLEQTSKEEEEQEEEKDEVVDAELMELQELMQELIKDGDQLQKMIAHVNFHEEELKQITASEEEIAKKDFSNDAANKKDVKDEDEDFNAEITMDELIDGHEAINKINSVVDDRSNNNAESNSVDNSCTPECIDSIGECSAISSVITNNVNAETNDTTEKNNEINERQHAALMLALESFTLVKETEDTKTDITNTKPLWLDDEDIDDDDTKATEKENTDLENKYTCKDNNKNRSKINASNKHNKISDSANNRGSDELTEDEVYEDDFETDENDDASRGNAVDVYIYHET